MVGKSKITMSRSYEMYRQEPSSEDLERMNWFETDKKVQQWFEEQEKLISELQDRMIKMTGVPKSFLGSNTDPF
jgi:uncharacterized membrane protein